MNLILILVNQLGYLSNGPKGATVTIAEDQPLPWEIKQGDQVVASGLTVPFGEDPTVGQFVHTIDFSDFENIGEYEISVTLPDGSRIAPKDIIIATDPYSSALVDALKLFTLQRSGFEISADIAGPEYARPAGHLNGAPNRGDSAIAPLPQGAYSTTDGVDLYDGWTGDYLVDAEGGWYDAGDMGKYVVNGGISVAQLLGIVSRLQKVPDRTPEQQRALDIALSEALWELDWMLKMVVPEGQPFAGMVHHKVSDEHWTGIPTLPADDPQIRYIHRPSTAATLNLAAVAAQAASVLAEQQAIDAISPNRKYWAFDPYHPGEPIDPDLSRAEGRNVTVGESSKYFDGSRYIAAARKAYEAAKNNPILIAPDTNVLPNPGSGPYDDKELDDEWYWAAAELYFATGDTYFLNELRANPYHIANPHNEGRVKSPWSEVGFDWRDTAAWARIQLTYELLEAGVGMESDIMRAELLAQADKLIAKHQPFGQLYSPADNKYAWGSNGMIANNAAIVAAAYDISGDPKYRAAALAGIDYLFGRNVLDISYVTGYGDKYVENQHSRWFAYQVDPSLPNPPRGTLSGGPNSDVPDPAAQHLQGRPAQYCFVDDIASYGTNEMTINWNAALAYLLAFAVTV